MKTKSSIFFLIGLPGVGKTFIGKEIATQLDYTFFDLDKEIERVEKDTITSIFKNKGETYFRKLEQKVLKELCKNEKKIIALGGGTPCFYDNLKTIKDNGYCIWLGEEIEIIAQRIRKSKNKRPLFKENEDIEKQLLNLLSKRKSYYRQADTYFENSKNQKQEIIAFIKNINEKKLLEKNLPHRTW